MPTRNRTNNKDAANVLGSVQETLDIPDCKNNCSGCKSRPAYKTGMERWNKLAAESLPNERESRESIKPSVGNRLDLRGGQPGPGACGVDVLRFCKRNAHAPAYK
jgi:hypothetical protein